MSHLFCFSIIISILVSKLRTIYFNYFLEQRLHSKTLWSKPEYGLLVLHFYDTNVESTVSKTSLVIHFINATFPIHKNRTNCPKWHAYKSITTIKCGETTIKSITCIKWLYNWPIPLAFYALLSMLMGSASFGADFCTINKRRRLNTERQNNINLNRMHLQKRILVMQCTEVKMG
jgi:hypothetical protein